MVDASALSMLLRSLRLAQMNKHWQAEQERALAEGWSPAHYLSKLCELEVAHRESERLKRYQKEARLPAGKTLASFDFTVAPSLDTPRLTQLCESRDWLDEGQNVLLFGPSGIGKTHLAAAIGHAMTQQGLRVRFLSGTALVQQLLAAKRELALNAMLLRLDKIKLLIIDDLGYVKRSEMETSVLFELIAHRYERGSLVLTANQPFSEWDSIFSDRLMTVAAVDRLVHHAHIFELEGESYRKSAARKRQQVAS